MNDMIDQLISVFTPGEHVLVAMSGGVDSSVAAWAAVKAGCKVTGVTLQLFDTDYPFWEDAERVAARLSIPWHLADYRRYFNEDVLSPYIATYKRGETPNPCCLCNRVAKTKYLFDEMQKAGATRIVTGHYASTSDHNGHKFITRSTAEVKDQSYYLSLMDPFHIGLMIYPYANVANKELVRQLAAELGLEVAGKRDSYEACFLKGQDYREFLLSKIGPGREGNFIFNSENIGRHSGIYNYTIGQRKGLEISRETPLYVKQINVKTSDIILAEKPELFLRGVRLRDTVFSPDEPIISRVTAKLRHKMPDAPCILEIQQGERAVLLFDEPQFAPAPGQVTTIYDSDRVIGGGVVDTTF